MARKIYDVIVVGCGSAGLTVGLFMNKAGFKVLLIDKTDHDIGGDCLNDGCVPSKSLIHVARLLHSAKEAQKFGFNITGEMDIRKVIEYVYSRQNIIRQHENAAHFRSEGIDVALGEAKFTGAREVEVAGTRYNGKKIVIATGSRPRKLKVPGIEKVTYYDNESIFHLYKLPQRLLVVGGGPIGIELGQAMSRLGSQVTVVHKDEAILPHDDYAITGVLHRQLVEEGIQFIFNAEVDSFPSANEVAIKTKEGRIITAAIDAVLVGIGRELNTNDMALENAGIDVRDGRIVVNEYFRTTNKHVFVCGDVAGSLQFSHAAEQHARMLLNNFFSPFKKKVNNDYMSWVTFTDPEVATFGVQQKDLEKRQIKYRRLDVDFQHDDRAVTDNHQYGKLVLFISQGSFLHQEKILGGSTVAPRAGELVQELILANSAKLPIKAIFNKIYPYPVAARINQKAIVDYKQEGLTDGIKKLLRFAFKVFSR